MVYTLPSGSNPPPMPKRRLGGQTPTFTVCEIPAAPSFAFRAGGDVGATWLTYTFLGDGRRGGTARLRWDSAPATFRDDRRPRRTSSFHNAKKHYAHIELTTEPTLLRVPTRPRLCVIPILVILLSCQKNLLDGITGFTGYRRCPKQPQGLLPPVHIQGLPTSAHPQNPTPSGPHPSPAGTPRK